MKECELKDCKAKFSPKVFWQKFCSDGCKFIAYGLKKKEERNKIALKEANKVFKK